MMQKETKKTIECILNEKIKKPSSPVIVEGQEELTQEEFRKRLFVEQQLSSVGISTTAFDGKNVGYENPYILEAILLANAGKEIPEDLRTKIKELTEHNSCSEWRVEYMSLLLRDQEMRAAGREEGRKEGREEKRRAIVENMLKENMSKEVICRIAECDEAYIEDVRKSMCENENM